MKQVVVAVFDRAASLYGRPFFVRSAGEAIRSFSDEINRPAEGNQFASHPDDFDLWQVAIYDDQLGAFENGPQMLVRGKDVVTKEA